MIVKKTKKKTVWVKTDEKSPRAKSRFESGDGRETYRMSQEILDILDEAPEGKEFSCQEIIHMGTSKGYCRPFADSKRIASAHPYYKVLSCMMDPKSKIFCNTLEREKNGNIWGYRIRRDAYRKPSGSWRKRPGVPLKFKLPSDGQG